MRIQHLYKITPGGSVSFVDSFNTPDGGVGTAVKRAESHLCNSATGTIFFVTNASNGHIDGRWRVENAPSLVRFFE